MRPINSMIEFKQIIGRGTRLFDGKDYFTVYDFVNAHHLFGDPAWDGEPIDETTEKKPLPPAVDPPEPQDPANETQPPASKLEIKLRDGKARAIQYMSSTTFFGVDGKPMSAQDFIASLFDTLTLPEFFTSEEELREIWSVPSTRLELLNRLDEAGFDRESLKAIQSLMEAENCDLFDVLEFVAFAHEPVTRAERAVQSRITLEGSLDSRQMEFIDFVLSKYVESGFEELDTDKLPVLIELKYQSLADGMNVLGGAQNAKTTFITFQKDLYGKNEAAAS